MNDHARGVEITAYLDGALEVAARTRVEAHLSACADCRAEADSLRHLKALLARAPRKRLPVDLAFALVERGASRAPAPRRALLWASSGALAAAALLAAARLGGWGLAAEEIPLEPLLTAHARYSAESPLTGMELAASSYSASLGETEDTD